MPRDSRDPEEGPAPHNLLAMLSEPRSVVKLAIIGVLLLCIIGSFAYVAGWLSPRLLTPRRFVDGFQQVSGVHPGFRRNHAKGMCISGYFDSNGQGAHLSKANLFESGRATVIGRFSTGGGQPSAADSPTAVRGLGLRFEPRDGQEWRTAMIDFPVFPFRTPQAFYENLLASKIDPATGKPDPAKMGAFFAAHPETARPLAIIKAKPFSSGFANATYSGLNAFWFTNAAGVAMAVRWSMVPVDPFVAANATTPANKNYLFDDFIDRVRRGPVQWHLIVTVGQPGDHTDDATLPWPEAREHVDVGTVTIDNVEDEAHGNCRDTNFDPLVLPDGITPSDDPLLSARSAVYSVSFRRREGEKKGPSPIQIPASGKGG
ncbi:MAG TPA: catalase family peroxidase [Candidatus Binataceae bacterium]|nr:catalase family peroxidase [Candidatus Binataceae bacterium]